MTQNGLVHITSIDVGVRNFAIRVENLNLPGHAVLFELVDFASTTKILTEQISNLIIYLKRKYDILKHSSALIIEHQDIFIGQRINSNRNIRLMQAVLTFFELQIPTCQRIEATPTFKVQKLTGYTGARTRKAIKAWVQVVAPQYLSYIKDEKSLQMLNTMADKMDDVCDATVQLWVYRLLYLPDTTSFFPH